MQRAVQQELDIQLGRPGTLQAIALPRVNAGRTGTSGVDMAIRADFLTNMGRFTPELVATWFDRYEADIPGSVAGDWAGRANELGSIPSWRANLKLGWRRGPYAATTFVRYTPSYEDGVAGMDAGRNVGSLTVVDLQASIDLNNAPGKSLLWKDIRLALGAINLFDVEPPYAEVGGIAGFDLTVGDLKQRLWYMRVEKRF